MNSDRIMWLGTQIVIFFHSWLFANLSPGARPFILKSIQYHIFSKILKGNSGSLSIIAKLSGYAFYFSPVTA